MKDERLIQRANRRRVAALLVLVSVIVPLLFVVEQAVVTLRTLTDVERARDAWQQPADVIRSLNLHAGNIVVDFGSGAGYFALKLAPVVGPDGRVLAVDLRRESLAFLWIRAMFRGQRHVRVIVGAADDPLLPPGLVDAVLVANTYHELVRPGPVLRALRASMRSGARLVIVDRAPADSDESREGAAEHHEIGPDAAAADMQRAGFEFVSRQDRFIARSPDGASWWLAVFRKP